jgi:hypothetical protein
MVPLELVVTVVVELVGVMAQLVTVARLLLVVMVPLVVKPTAVSPLISHDTWRVAVCLPQLRTLVTILMVADCSKAPVMACPTLSQQ